MEFTKRKQLERFLDWLAQRGFDLEKKTLENAKNLVLFQICDHAQMQKSFLEFSKDWQLQEDGKQRLLGLVELPVGACAVISMVSPSAKERLRLLELGFITGAKVRCVRYAPLGDPIEYELSGSLISLRKTEACEIMVRQVKNESPI